MDIPHEPQYCVNLRDAKTYQQIILISESYAAAESLWDQVQKSWREPWKFTPSTRR